MDRPKLEVADVFRRYGEAYRQQHGASMSRGQRRVMSAIEVCRTATLAATSNVVINVAMNTTLSTAAAIDIVPNASVWLGRNGSRTGKPNFFRCPNVALLVMWRSGGQCGQVYCRLFLSAT